MEFGRLENLDDVDWSLPKLAPAPHLQQTSEPLTLHLGTPQWGDDAFVGKLYPPETKKVDYLAAYARQVSAIELNTTFYGTNAERLSRWASVVPCDFRFCPKLPKAISHDARLRDARSEMDAFIGDLSGLGLNLGVTWILLPPDFTPDELPALERFVERYAPRLSLAVEFRHAAWFREPILSRWIGRFRALGVTAVMTDTAGRRDVLHGVLTTSTALIRFTGNRLIPSDYARLDAWTTRLSEYEAQGLTTAYFFLHQPAEHLNVELLHHLSRRLSPSSICLRGPSPDAGAPRQGSLF